MTSIASNSRPLVIGDAAFPRSALPLDAEVGMLRVAGNARDRDGVLVQRCLCGCSRSSCPVEADFDVRYLNNPANFTSDGCPLQGKQFFPPFAELAAAIRSKGVGDTEQYRKAYARGYLPKGAPADPTEYEEWTSWADFTGVPDYHSERELFDGLLAMDLNSLGLLPRPDRRRVLVFSKYWASICAKAKDLGIDEKQIPDRLEEIVATLRPASRNYYDEANSAKAGGGGTGMPRKRGMSEGLTPLTLKQHGALLIDSVTVWLPTGPEIQGEIITGFFHNVWETLDREDTLRGNGLAAVEEAILSPLRPVKPESVEEFLRQYKGVSRYKVGPRNWMQAYSLWYAESHMRFINWSSAGLGKTRTIPAIVTAHDIRLTVLFSPKVLTNEHNHQIAAELAVEDARAVIHYSDYGVPPELAPGKHHYFVANPEKLQQGAKTIAMIDALMAHHPGLIVFDEAHLLVSPGLVDPDSGETQDDPKYKPRMTGLRHLLDALEFDQRIVLLTGTPVRVDAREGQALLELVGEDVGEFTKEMKWPTCSHSFTALFMFSVCRRKVYPGTRSTLQATSDPPVGIHRHSRHEGRGTADEREITWLAN